MVNPPPLVKSQIFGQGGGLTVEIILILFAATITAATRASRATAGGPVGELIRQRDGRSSHQELN